MPYAKGGTLRAVLIMHGTFLSRNLRSGKLNFHKILSCNELRNEFLMRMELIFLVVDKFVLRILRQKSNLLLGAGKPKPLWIFA